MTQDNLLKAMEDIKLLRTKTIGASAATQGELISLTIWLASLRDGMVEPGFPSPKSLFQVPDPTSFMHLVPDLQMRLEDAA